MIVNATYIGGPFDGFSKTFDHMPNSSEQIAVNIADGSSSLHQPTMTSQFISAVYTPTPLGQSDEHVVMLYEGNWSDFARFAPPVESDLLCAHCGRDPATGKEVDET